MRIVEQSWDWRVPPYSGAAAEIEDAARVCTATKSGECNAEAEEFVRRLIKKGHESPLEHEFASIEVVTSRAVMCELTRHRLASFSVESQRYVKYEELEVINPVWWGNWSKEEQQIWTSAMHHAEREYQCFISLGCKPEKARDVLPNATATTFIMTANLREWRHILKLRTARGVYPQTRLLMLSVLKGFQEQCPAVFGDIAME